MPIKDPNQQRRNRRKQIGVEHGHVPQSTVLDSPIVDEFKYRLVRRSVIRTNKIYGPGSSKRQKNRLLRLAKKEEQGRKKLMQILAETQEQFHSTSLKFRPVLKRTSAASVIFNDPDLVRESAHQVDQPRSVDLDLGESSPLARDPILDFAAEAGRLGVPMEPVPEIERAKKIIEILAKDAVDLFESTERGVEFLSNRDIDGYGNTGLSLLAARGVSAVLMKLDELRFGSAC